MERRRKKQIIIIVLCAMMAFVLTFLAVSIIAGMVGNSFDILGIGTGNTNNTNPNSTPEKPKYLFYEADYKKNILEDPEYLSKDRLIYLCDPRYGITESISEDDRASKDPAFQLLCTMIDYCIAGNADRYNELFSSEYYSIEGNERKEKFPMQQIYDIKITVDPDGGMSQKTDENGKKYTQYSYIVEFKIRQNNGKLYNDVDSDAAKRRQFIISNAHSDRVDTFLIDQVNEYRYSYG